MSMTMPMRLIPGERRLNLPQGRVLSGLMSDGDEQDVWRVVVLGMTVQRAGVVSEWV